MKQNLFTPREIEVMQVVWNCDTNIYTAADRLRISHNTVRVHLASCSKKLGTSGEGRTKTLLTAGRQGYITT